MNKNLNASLTRLQALAKRATPEPGSPSGEAQGLYGYVVATSQIDAEGRLRQSGCGPNFQGDLITITSCKRRMRAARTVDVWPGQWVAGLSSSRLHQGRQALLFLTQVEHAYASHAELWQALPPAVRAAKSARSHIHGDVFEPREKVTDEAAFDPASYYPPRKGHRHEALERWHRDIHHPTWGRPAALLVGAPDRSFLWTEPELFYRGQLTQGYKKWTSLSDFLEELAVAR